MVLAARRLRARASAAVVAVMVGSGLSITVAVQTRGSAVECRVDGRVTPISGLQEASGIAVSRRIPGRLWSHNDAGETLFALDTRGAVTGRLQLSGLKIEDWEAIAVGPCPGGSCVYIGDIGDNQANRRRITVYRFPEPSESETSATVKEAFHGTYPDGAHDAEALLVMPDGGLFIVTKGETSAVALYRFPRELRAGTTHQLERVGAPRGSAKASASERVTDGAVSPDGESVVLRTSEQLMFYRTADLLAGNWRATTTVDLKPAGETQGEGVALGADRTVYLTGEAGGKSPAGTFARLMCR